MLPWLIPSAVSAKNQLTVISDLLGRGVPTLQTAKCFRSCLSPPGPLHTADLTSTGFARPMNKRDGGVAWGEQKEAELNTGFKHHIAAARFEGSFSSALDNKACKACPCYSAVVIVVNRHFLPSAAVWNRSGLLYSTGKVTCTFHSAFHLNFPRDVWGWWIKLGDTFWTVVKEAVSHREVEHEL